MPLLANEETNPTQPAQCPAHATSSSPLPTRHSTNAGKQSQHSVIAKSAIMSQFVTPPTNGVHNQLEMEGKKEKDNELSSSRISANSPSLPFKGSMQSSEHGAALTDTPSSTAPNSPKM